MSTQVPGCGGGGAGDGGESTVVAAGGGEAAVDVAGEAVRVAPGADWVQGEKSLEQMYQFGLHTVEPP